MSVFSRTFTIDCALPPEEARKALLPVVRTRPPLCVRCAQPLVGGRSARFCEACGQPAIPESSFAFEGSLTPNGFRITRIIHYRNACLPVIQGKFQTAPAGTRIAIEMNMHPLGYVLLLGGSILTFGIPMLITFSQNTPPTSDVLILASFLAPCFLFLVCWLFFSLEVGTAWSSLDRIWPKRT